MPELDTNVRIRRFNELTPRMRGYAVKTPADLPQSAIDYPYSWQSEDHAAWCRRELPEGLAARLWSQGWSLFWTTDGRIRVCTMPAVHPVNAAAGTLDAESHGYVGVRILYPDDDDDQRVALVACGYGPVRWSGYGPEWWDIFNRGNVPVRLRGRVLTVRTELLRMAAAGRVWKNGTRGDRP